MSQINMYSAFYVKFLLMDIDIYFLIISKKAHWSRVLKNAQLPRVHSSYPWGREGSGREVLGKGTFTHLFCYVPHCFNLLQQNSFVYYSGN